MITKERLEELIEQNGTVYMTNGYTEGIFLEKRNFEVTDKELVFKYKIYAVLLEDLFETEEEAKEYLEFGNITRTERLELPSWEEFNKVYNFTFESKDRIMMELAIWFIDLNGNDKTIKITELNDWNVRYFEKPLTRENYNEARRLCVKLFKGE